MNSEVQGGDTDSCHPQSLPASLPAVVSSVILNGSRGRGRRQCRGLGSHPSSFRIVSQEAEASFLQAGDDEGGSEPNRMGRCMPRERRPVPLVANFFPGCPPAVSAVPIVLSVFGAEGAR